MCLSVQRTLLPGDSWKKKTSWNYCADIHMGHCKYFYNAEDLDLSHVYIFNYCLICYNIYNYRTLLMSEGVARLQDCNVHVQGMYIHMHFTVTFFMKWSCKQKEIVIKKREIVMVEIESTCTIQTLLIRNRMNGSHCKVKCEIFKTCCYYLDSLWKTKTELGHTGYRNTNNAAHNVVS